MVNKQRIIIDTDAGHDDALAMMLLLGSKKFDVLAVTTVAGNSTIDKVTRNAQAVLNLVHAQVPLHSGRSKPLRRELVIADVHGESGIDGLDVSSVQYELDGKAVDSIHEMVNRYPHEVSLVTLGPLSNIAQLLTKYPEDASLIAQIVIMGGAIDVPGNKNRVAEFNFFVDPEAADIVISSGIAKKVLVPLDPCNSIRLSLDTFKPLQEKQIYTPLMSMMRHFIAGIAKYEHVNAALVYDALAAYYLVNPHAYELKPMDIVVETKGEYTYGMTIAEKRAYVEPNYNVHVTVTIDPAAFTRDLLASLKSIG